MTLPKLFNRLSSQEQDRMLSLQRAMRIDPGNAHTDFKFVGMCNGLLDKALSRDGRIAFYRWLFGREIQSSHDLTAAEQFNLVSWIGPRKTGNERSDPWVYSKDFMSDLPLIIQLFSGGIGQPALPSLGQAVPTSAEDRKARMKRNMRDLGYYDE